jgi:hypothetical protein
MGSAMVGAAPAGGSRWQRARRTTWGTGPIAVRVVTLLLLFIVAVAVGTLVRIGTESTGTTSSTAPAPRPTERAVPVNSAALDWVRGQLPPGSVVATDARAAALLRPGVATVPIGAGQRSDLSGVDFVMATNAVRQAARGSTSLAQLLSSAVPVAVFGTGRDAVTVAGVASNPAGVRADRARDLASRRRAEPELLANKRVRAAPRPRQVLQSGGLDLRGATVLAELAGHGRVTIVDVPIDAAEAAAGLPARTVEIRLRNQALLQLVDSVGPNYRPTVTRRSNGVIRLTWPVTLAVVGG